ncbi:MAG TPA: rhodanese-like domain-containing protein [Polyangia bacterium]|jgi:rhodanese-related sulfurtransferase|nr:rhodanese-like domain-containing protein [Polyangia bacterium]
MKTLAAALVSFLVAVPVVAYGSGAEFGSLTPQEVAAKLKEKNVYVFDNNDPDTFKAGHVPHAKWLHPSEYDAKELPADKSAMLIFYCHNEH